MLDRAEPRAYLGCMNETFFTEAQPVKAGLDPRKVEALLSFLSVKFGVAVPRIKWDHKRRASYSHGGTLNIGQQSWRGYNSVLHEFAHHLQHVREQQRPKQVMSWFSRPRTRHHGPDFCQALRDVVRAAFGAEDLYPWITEYRCVKSWYERQNGRTVYGYGRALVLPRSSFATTLAAAETGPVSVVGTFSVPAADDKKAARKAYNAELQKIRSAAELAGWVPLIAVNAPGYWKALRVWARSNGYTWPSTKGGR